MNFITFMVVTFISSFANAADVSCLLENDGLEIELDCANFDSLGSGCSSSIKMDNKDLSLYVEHSPEVDKDSYQFVVHKNGSELSKKIMGMGVYITIYPKGKLNTNQSEIFSIHCDWQ